MVCKVIRKVKIKTIIVIYDVIIDGYLFYKCYHTRMDTTLQSKYSLLRIRSVRIIFSSFISILNRSQKSFAGYENTRNFNIYVTSTSLPNNTVINSVQDLRDRGITETEICGSVRRFRQAEIVSVVCGKRGRYVVIHQFLGAKFTLCEVIVIGNPYVGVYIHLSLK